MSSSFFGSNDVASWWLDKDEDEENPFKAAEENEKDCTIFVIDCNQKMFDEKLIPRIKDEDDDEAMSNNDNKEEERNVFGSVCKAIEHALKRKIIKTKDDLVCVMLFNTLETKNAMKLSNIYLLSEPDSPSAKLIKQIRDLPMTFSSNFKSLKENKQCDFRDLLWTLQNIFSEIDVKGTKYGSKRAFIFTNNDHPHFKDENATKSKANDMLESGMEINVFPLKERFNVKAFYKVKSHYNDYNAMKYVQGYIITKYYEFSENIQDVCSLDLDELSRNDISLLDKCPTLQDLEDGLRVKEMKKRSIASVPLTIGPNFKMAVKMYSLYRRATKESPQWLDARTNQPLTTETRWICADTGQILDPDQQIRTYHEYGPSKERVYFTKDEMKDLKTFGNPSLTLMGFKPLSRLKPYHQIKPSQFIYPDEGRCTGSTVAFNALIQAMDEMKQFAVCRYIFRKVSAPRFVALVAQKENAEKGIDPGMNMIFLPYADDIRKVEFKGQDEMERVDQDNPKHMELVEKSKKIIDKLTVEEMYQPSNPTLQRHYDALEALALEQVGGDDDDDEDDEKYLNNAEDEIMPNDEALMDAAGDEIKEFLRMIEEEFSDLGVMGSAAAPKATRKRKAAAPKTKAKKRKIDTSNVSELDWKDLAEKDELKSLKVKDLKVYLNENGLKMSGKKADLIERIKGHLGL